MFTTTVVHTSISVDVSNLTRRIYTLLSIIIMGASESKTQGMKYHILYLLLVLLLVFILFLFFGGGVGVVGVLNYELKQ